MHSVKIRQHIIDRVTARRGKSHWFESLEKKRTALVVIDMQSTFCEEGAPAEVATARSIVPHINSLTTQLRAMGVPIFWVLHANTHLGERSDWELFFNHVVADDVRSRTMRSLMPGKLNLPLLDVPLSHFIMRPSIAVPRPSVSQTASD